MRSSWIFVGLIIGAAAGVGLHYAGQQSPAPAWHGAALWVIDLLGPTFFKGALMMIIAPLIFSSIVAAVVSLPDISELGAIGFKTLLYYMFTTLTAVSIGLGTGLLLQPGKSSYSASERQKALAAQELLREAYALERNVAPLSPDGAPTPEYRRWLAARKSDEARGGADARRFQTMTAAQDRAISDVIRDDIFRPILMNPFQALASSPPNALAIIFFALLLGAGCTVVGAPAAPLAAAMQALAEVMMRITHWVMLTAPVAVGCLVADLVARTGPNVFATLGYYALSVVLGLTLHVSVLMAVLALIGRMSPARFLSGMREAFLVAFTTRSSAATLPVTMSCVTEKLGMSKKVAGFTLPLGATVNMDGTALYQSVAILFLLQLFGGLDDVPVRIDAGVLTLILFTATLASIGAAAVPSAGLITMVIVATAVGLPTYYLLLIFAVDAVLDMFRTTVNIMGDAVGVVVVNRLESGRLGAISAP